MSQHAFQPQSGTDGANRQPMEYASGVEQGPGGGPSVGQQAPGASQQFRTGGQQPQMGAQQYGMSGQPLQAGGPPGLRSGQQSAQPGQVGRQTQQPQQTMAQRSEQGLENSLTNEMRLALHDFVQAATVCEWCADQCIGEGPMMAECIRLCRDVADLATLNVQFMARDSQFGPELAETFAYAAEECANECAQHGHVHCQECASELRRAVDSTWRMLESFEHGHAGGTRQQVQQY